MPLLFVGTYGEKLGHVDGKGKGIYVLRFDRETLSIQADTQRLRPFFGQPQLGGAEGFTNPTFLTTFRNAQGRLDLYVAEESHSAAGFIAAVAVDEATGELRRKGEAVPSGTDEAMPAACCHVSVTPGGKHVLAANYLSGSVVAVARRDDGTLDGASVQHVRLPPAEHPVAFPLPNAARQEMSHAHMALVSAGTHSTTVLVPDLGADIVWSIPYDGANAASPLGTPVPTASHPALAGFGPRHVALHPTEPFCYVAYELASAVAAFKIDRRTGAIVGAPVGVVCALEGVASKFLKGEDEAFGGAKLPSGWTVGASKAYAHFVGESPNDWTSIGRPGHGRSTCDDKATSVAAVVVAPDASHVLVSSRIVGKPGVLSAVPLTASGMFVDDVDRPVRITSTLGRCPRDFTMLPALESSAVSRKRARRVDSGLADADSLPQAATLAIVANQDDDKIVVVCEGGLAQPLTEEVPTPVCLCWAPPA